MRVHTLTKSGKILQEPFASQTEAVNYARQRSLGSLCAILQEADDSLVFYEHGDKVNDQERVSELSALVEEMSYLANRQAVKDGSRTRQ